MILSEYSYLFVVIVFLLLYAVSFLPKSNQISDVHEWINKIPTVHIDSQQVLTFLEWINKVPTVHTDFRV